MREAHRLRCAQAVRLAHHAIVHAAWHLYVVHQRAVLVLLG